MDVGNILLYKERWQAVEAIEQQELRYASPQELWRQLNHLRRRAHLLGMDVREDEETLGVIVRWARLKTLYLSNVLS